VTTILIRYAEIGLKGTTVRTRFENRLMDNILTMLATDGVEAMVNRGEARFFVETEDVDRAVASLRRVFGIASLSVAEVAGAGMEEICAAAAEYSKGRIAPGQSFAVRARREGSHAYTSMDVGREAGSAIFEANEGLKVDLTRPDKVFYIEIRNNRAYIFDTYIRCHAGLPLGSQGRVLADVDDDRGILSAWLMMKRGCKVIVRSDRDCPVLRRYDPELKVIDAGQDVPRRVHGIVLGTALADLEGVDVAAYDLPVFFPTIGMTDAEVDARMRIVLETD